MGGTVGSSNVHTTYFHDTGAGDESVGHYFAGVIDELRLYNRELGYGEVGHLAGAAEPTNAGEAGTYAVARDGRGNQLATERFAFLYDAYNRIIQVTDLKHEPGSGSPSYARYGYDGYGRRVRKQYFKANGTPMGGAWPDVFVVYSGVTPIEEWTIETTPKLLRRYVYEKAINYPVLVEEDTDGDGAFTNDGERRMLITDDRGTLMGVVSKPSGESSYRLTERLKYNTTGVTYALQDDDGSWTNKTYGGIPGADNVSRSTLAPFGWTGMWRDRFTGLHHTHYREYDAAHEQWLQRDPAGYPDGMNPWRAYMGVNVADVLGLAGYFFDGTGNQPHAQKINGEVNYITNVRKLYLAYGDTKTYVPGIGSGYYADGSKYPEKGLWIYYSSSAKENEADPNVLEYRRRRFAMLHEAITGKTMHQRVDYMMSRLERNLVSGDNVVDLFGFSRGSASALEFLNRIQDKIDSGDPKYKDIRIRFVGLFDVVPSMRQSLSGPHHQNDDYWTRRSGGPTPYKKSTYRFQLPENMKFENKPVHFVALDEQRTKFQQINLKGSMQIGFRGVHSDVGGGYGPENEFEWITRDAMVISARASGVSFKQTVLDIFIHPAFNSRAEPTDNDSIIYDLEQRNLYLDDLQFHHSVHRFHTKPKNHNVPYIAPPPPPKPSSDYWNPYWPTAPR